MANRAVIGKIKSPDKGIFLNLAKDAIDSRGWSNGLNVMFKDGYVKTSPGWTKYTSQLIPYPITCGDQFFMLDGTNFMILVTTTKVYWFDTGSSTWTDITGTDLTAVVSDFVSTDTWPDLFLFTNNKDRVRKWTGSGNVASLLGLDTADDGSGGTVDVSTAKSLSVFSGFVHVFGPVEDGVRLPQRWRWSKFNNAEGWNNTGTYGQAGYADITDGSDHIMCGRRLGNDYMAIYKEHSIHIGQYVGPPVVFARRLVIANIGLRAPGAVADLGDEHIFFGDDNFYVFNGLSIKPIGDAIFNQFIDELNPAKVDLVKAFVVEEENEVWFIYPTSGNDTPNKMACYNYNNGAWSFRDAPFTCLFRFRESLNKTWDAMVGTWESHPERWDSRIWSSNNPIILAGQNAGYVQKIGAGVYAQDGSDHDSYVISKAFDMDRPDVIKRFLRCFIDAVKMNAYDMDVSFAVLNHVHDTPSFGAPVTFDMALSGQPWVNMDTAGRFLMIKFRTNGTAVPWQLSGYGLEFLTRGRY